MAGISVIIITKDEEENIEACLESVKWADEVIVVDDMSQDHTPQICQRYANVKIYQRKMENGYGPQKNYALENAKGEWVLSIDADERVTPELREEILKRLGKENFSGYYFKMKYLAFGKWILDHPARNLRLFKRNIGKFTNKMVHEKVVIKGEIGVMKNPILHFCRSYRSIEDYLSTQNRYTSYTANDLYNMGRRIKFISIFFYFVIKPIFVFFRKFIFWGYKYRFHGFLLSALVAYDYFLSYAKLWDKQRKRSE